MATSNVMQSLGNTAKRYRDMAKSLPMDDSTVAGLKASAQNVSGSALAQEPQETAKDTSTRPSDLVSPMNRYGSRPGEKRLDSEGNEAPAAKVYDDGGDVPMPNSTSDANNAAASNLINALKPKDKKAPAKGIPDVKQESQDAINVPQSTSNAAPGMPVMAMPTGTTVPVDDQGADVDVNDGQHELAILKHGEKVLNPEEAEAYRAGQATQMQPLGSHGDVTASRNGKDIPLEKHGTVHEHMDVDTGKPSSSLPPLTPETHPTKLAPTYDQGGDVGAPTDFGGRVMPNPNGVKPMLDTEIPPPETERISGEAKMNTDNAPLSNPKGDISNPEQAQVLPPAPPEVQAAGQKEAGVKAAPQPAPEVKGTEAERRAIEVDKKQAMGTGNLVKLGTALLNERHLKPMANEPKLYDEGGDVTVPEDKLKAPPEFNQGYQPMSTDPATPQHGVEAQGAGTEPAAQKPAGVVAPPEMARPQMKQMQAPQATAAQPAAAAVPPPVAPQMSYKDKIADYDQRHQQALDEGTLEGKTKADYIAYAKQAFISKNPWGSPDNHPGIMGKLGHGLAKAGEIAANVVAPGITAAVPGSMVNRGMKQMQTQADIREDQPMLTTQQAEENKTDKTLAPTYREATQGGIVDPAHPELGPQQAYVDEKDPSKVKFLGPMPAKAETLANKPATEADIADYQKRIAAAGLDPNSQAAQVYGSAPAGATKAELDKRFEEATKLRGMDQKDAETQIQNQMRQDAADEKKKGKYYTYNDEKGTHVVTGDKLDSLPPDTDYSTVKDISQLVGEGRAMNAVQDSLNDLHKDIEQHPEVFDNAVARGIVQTTTEQMDRASAGLLIAGTGGSVPIPSGFGDSINTYLQNRAVDPKTAKAVKDYIADYKAMKDKAMVIQMMMQNGKMGRGGQQAFASIVDQLPGGSTPDTPTAKRQMNALQRTTSGLMGKYPEEYGDYKKSKPYTEAQQTAQPAEGAAQKYNVGQQVQQGDKTYTVTSVDANGNITGTK